MSIIIITRLLNTFQGNVKLNLTEQSTGIHDKYDFGLSPYVDNYNYQAIKTSQGHVKLNSGGRERGILARFAPA